MRKRYLIGLLILAVAAKAALAQENKLTPFDKKFHFGISLNNYWTTVKGDNLPREYFTKPSIGFNFRAEYYFTKFLGLGVGAGYQQLGMGIINKDYNQSYNDPDSTYRERVRFHTIEIPISVLLRTPKDVIKGIRLSGAIGITPVKVFKATDIFHSVEDGHHLLTPVDDQYLSSDLLTQVSLGPEIDSGGTGLFQIHFVYARGTKNVYSQNQGNGVNQSWGLRIAWLLGSNLHTKSD